MSQIGNGPLAALRWHWGSAYTIHVFGDTWVAQRRDTQQTLKAETPEALRDAILADYTAKPVPREQT